MGRVLALVGSGLSAMLTLLAMILAMVSVGGRQSAGVFGDALAQILFVLGSVLLVGLAALALVLAIIGAGKLSTTKVLKGIGIALAAIVYFSGWWARFDIWWFYILLGDLLIYLGAMQMEGQLTSALLTDEKQASGGAEAQAGQ